MGKQSPIRENARFRWAKGMSIPVGLATIGKQFTDEEQKGFRAWVLGGVQGCEWIMEELVLDGSHHGGCFSYSLVE